MTADQAWTYCGSACLECEGLGDCFACDGMGCEECDYEGVCPCCGGVQTAEDLR
jgi:hypothetical protein